VFSSRGLGRTAYWSVHNFAVRVKWTTLPPLAMPAQGGLTGTVSERNSHTSGQTEVQAPGSVGAVLATNWHYTLHGGIGPRNATQGGRRGGGAAADGGQRAVGARSIVWGGNNRVWHGAGKLTYKPTLRR
jgi:hypothetical protein